jgi:hypothetical protein
MTPPSLTEISMALQGSIQLARLDAGGLKLFNRTPAGFWRSFFAAILTAPLRVYMVLLARQIPDTDPLRVITVETISYVISWLIYPFAMLIVVDLIGRRERYFDYMVAYNWASIPQNVLQVLVITIAVASPPLGGLLFLIVIVSLLVYQWFIARSALLISSTVAVALALFEFALGLALDRITQALLRA